MKNAGGILIGLGILSLIWSIVTIATAGPIDDVSGLGIAWGGFGFVVALFLIITGAYLSRR